jgi:hypothetical protein
LGADGPPTLVRLFAKFGNVRIQRFIPARSTHGHRSDRVMLMKAAARLHAIKLVHTLIWAFFAACVFAIPVAAWVGRLDYALALIAVVMIEVLVLVLNAWRCPLQDVAARYTSDRSGNFDIYLPAWLAQRTMIIFGPLFAIGVIATALRWAAGG